MWSLALEDVGAGVDCDDSGPRLSLLAFGDAGTKLVFDLLRS